VPALLGTLRHRVAAPLERRAIALVGQRNNSYEVIAAPPVRLRGG
jgi:hypothetical protein